MLTDRCTIHFSDTPYAPIDLEKFQSLSEHLTIQNSPILFGCRTGICGTCLVVVKGTIPPADQAEQELLEVLAPNTPNARLACQIRLTADIDLAAIANG
ncbi:MAG: (2Fe-2S)-binding protein [Leptolyngbyaceae cyanobacterium SL_7_1]|nr:(2Fe-2S)-binding protein [Leptolyngbyaceae cyanobacterium SL_7_1]